MCRLSTTFPSSRFASTSRRHSFCALHATSSWVFARTCHPFESGLERAITITIGLASASLAQLYFSEVALLAITDSLDFVAFVAGDCPARLEEVP